MYNGVYTAEQYAYMHDTLQKWLSGHIKGESLGDRILAKGIDCIAIYGVSGLGQMAYDDIVSRVRIVNFIDKRADKYSKGYRTSDGRIVSVLSLAQLQQLPKECFVLVTPEYYFYEIMDDLSERGIPLERIISLSMVV